MSGIPSALKTSLLMLESPEPDILFDSLNKIIQFLDNNATTIPALLNSGYLEKILSLTYSTDEKIVKAAVALMSMMSEAENIYPAFANDKLIKKLMHLLSFAFSPEIQDESAAILGNMAKKEYLRTRIRQFDGIRTLLACVKASSDPDVLKNGSEALNELMLDDFNKKEVYHCEGMPVLFQFLNSSYNEIQKMGLLCLIRISTYYPTVKEVQTAETFQKLYEIIKAEKLDLPQTSLELIAQTLSVGYRLNQTQTSQLLRFIQSLDQAPTNDTMIIHVSKIIALLAGHAPELKINKDSWLASVLSYLEKASKPHSFFAALETVLILKQVSDKSSFSIPTYQQIWKRLWAIIQNVDGKLEDRHQALYLFSRVCNEAKSDRIKIDNETINMIVNYLKDPIMKPASLKFFTLVSLSEEYMESLFNSSIHTLLQEDIEKETGLESLQHVLFLIKWINKDGQASRKQNVVATVNSLINHITSVLLLGLTSTTESIRQTAASACILLFKSKTLPLDNLLETTFLTEIEKNVGEGSSFNLVWNALLDAYPTVRYAIQNNLPPTSRIHSLFFDMGKTLIERLKPSQKLFIDKLTTAREIIIVDLEQDTKLIGFIENLKTEIQEKDQVESLEIIAKRVSERMGGPIKNLPSNGYKCHVFILKAETKSNCIYIGHLKTGTFYHRALLFKVVCDQLNLVCSLNRGAQFPKAWNTVSVFEQDEKMMQDYVVDLMGNPGKLMLLNTRDARQYIS